MLTVRAQAGLLSPRSHQLLEEIKLIQERTHSKNSIARMVKRYTTLENIVTVHHTTLENIVTIYQTR